MDLIGWIATVVVGVVVLGGLACGMSSLPDYNRYRRFRKM